ncbi:DUF599 domain-containing protein [Phenylobacterium glaciei]|uniref:DUF599 domain-containing protein n=1 Tax=Phenylobacterium glaciei TaxID=2803784 RepID=UPI00201C1C9F|nr:DUF599 family protein [Phenylobacterium glaciei]
MRLLLSPLDLAALVVFLLVWLAYEPLLKAAAWGKGAINTDMTVIRLAWMKNMAGRENKFMDGQLFGHVLNSASFFASSNLILIAGAASVLFGGESTFRSASSLVVIKTSTRILFEFQIALVLIALARGLLDFIWAIRQMNYCIAVVGAAPDTEDQAFKDRYGAAAAKLLNPALSAFNAGVRGYYFSLAAAAWLFGPIPFLVTTLGAVSLLIWRQRHSKAAGAIRDIRALLGG